jgi:ComF family protein
MIADFISLIYPDNCLSCGELLYKREKVLCLKCKYRLPKTNYHLLSENPVSRLFWGRIDLVSAAAYYLFKKGGGVQQLIHALKYDNRKEAGKEIGKAYGVELKKSPLFETVEVVIPVPLHPLKQRKRGYNQSDFIAEGIAEGMGIEWRNDVVTRVYYNESQTGKSKFLRWQNVESIFHLNNQKAIEGKHVLIVDDVITTGSTIESTALCAKTVEGTKVSVAALAYSGG